MNIAYIFLQMSLLLLRTPRSCFRKDVKAAQGLGKAMFIRQILSRRAINALPYKLLYFFRSYRMLRHNESYLPFGKRKVLAKELTFLRR
jgi:hypothetical protein